MIDFLHICEIKLSINVIICYISFIIKTRQRNFTNVISFNSMQFTLNSFHFISYNFLLKKILIYFSFLLLLTFVLIPFAFSISLRSRKIKKYIFDFNPTISLTIFSLNLNFILPNNFLFFINIIKKSCG